MNISIGAGIGIAGSCLGIAMVLITYIKQPKSTCQMHIALEKRMEGFEDWLGKVETKLDKVIERAMK